jgi:hypothetical protein
MIPDNAVAAIAENLAGLGLDCVTHAKVTAAVFAPLLQEDRTSRRREVSKQPPPADPKVSKPKPKRRHDIPAPSTGKAIAFLKTQLANGPKLASDVDRLAKESGIQPNALGRGKTQLGINVQRLNSGHGNAVHLSLPAG